MDRVLRVTVVVLMVGAGLVSASPAEAATIVVDSPLDVIDEDGSCTLREAIRAANTDSAFSDCPAGSGADTITLPAGTYVLQVAGEDQAGLEGDLDVLFGSTISIVGAGAATTIIDGGHIDRIFDVAFGGVLNLEGITLRNGGQANVTCEGGAIRSPGGTVVVSDSVIKDSIAGHGGAIYNTSVGHVTLDRTVVSGNTAAKIGGGISNENGGTFELSASVIENNVQQGVPFEDPPCANTVPPVGGGGIYSAGSLGLTDTTVAGNNAANFGGGILSVGDGSSLTVDRSTISGNATSTIGGGIYTSISQVEITGSTLSGNGAALSGAGLGGQDGSTFALDSVTVKNDLGTSSISTFGVITVSNSIIDAECSVAPTSLGYNIDAFGTCGFFEATDQQIEPWLGGLADNGGPTRTHKLLAPSPAIDKGACPSLATDQRGVPRPQGAGCDVGALESTPPSSAITFPRARAYSQSSFAAGCADVFKDVCGTASSNPDGAAPLGVEVSLQRASDNRFWDGAAFQPGPEVWNAASGAALWSYQIVLTEDIYRLRSRATDADGYMESTAEVIFTIDDTAPIARITSSKIRPRKNKAVFRFTSDESGSRFLCRIDSRAWRKCASPKAYENLQDGRHIFRVRARDAAGNVGPVARQRFRV